MRLILAAALTVWLGCGDPPAADDPPDPPTSVDDVIAKLTAIPGVTAERAPTATAGYAYVVVHFTQPVDHADPSGPSFQMEASLLYRDGSAPLVVQTSGYWDYYLDNPVELTQLLAANQLSIEHRFFASSRPEPADWSKLTIAQMADDEHAIIVAMHAIFPGKVLTTGGSKGGMTAVYHRRFYPDDVAGTVPYVAPISFGAPDARYTPFLDTVGPPACRQAVRDVAVELLANRRAAMLARATMQATTSGSAFTRVLIGPAVEVSIASLEWGFWQYYGLDWCPSVPPVTADDDTLFGFLDTIVPIADSDDTSSAQFEAYYHQAYAQLGYPAASVPYLEPYLMYTDADYLGSLPTTPPTYDDGAAMADIDGFVRQDSERMLFVYGQWDPWTGGAFELGAARDSLDLVQAEGTHGAHLTGLAPADRDAAFARLAAWTGVTPVIPPAPRMVAPSSAPILRVPPPRSRRLPVAAP